MATQIETMVTDYGEELVPNWKIALAFWWSYTWKAVLICMVVGLVVGFIIGLTVGVFLAILGVPRQFIGGISGLVSACINFPISIGVTLFFIQRTMASGFGNYRIVLLRR